MGDIVAQLEDSRVKVKLCKLDKIGPRLTSKSRLQIGGAPFRTSAGEKLRRRGLAYFNYSWGVRVHNHAVKSEHRCVKHRTINTPSPTSLGPPPSQIHGLGPRKTVPFASKPDVISISWTILFRANCMHWRAVSDWVNPRDVNKAATCGMPAKSGLTGQKLWVRCRSLKYNV
jgi:hypothetical protein